MPLALASTRQGMMTPSFPPRRDTSLTQHTFSDLRPLRSAQRVSRGGDVPVVQALCWLTWMEGFRRSVPGADRAFVLTSFYVLTGLHAIHVVGGLVPLGVCALYWHFLDAVWLAVFLTLMLGSL